MALHISADLLFEEELGAVAPGVGASGLGLDHCLKRNNISSSQAARESALRWKT